MLFPSFILFIILDSNSISSSSSGSAQNLLPDMPSSSSASASNSSVSSSASDLRIPISSQFLAQNLPPGIMPSSSSSPASSSDQSSPSSSSTFSSSISESSASEFLVLPLSSADAVIQPLNALLEQYFAPNNSIRPDQWERALPSDQERRQMRKLIRHLLQLDDFSALAKDPEFLARFAPLLAKSVALSFPARGHFCVIHEHLPTRSTSGPRRFPRFWGYTVLAARAHCARPHLHHSAPHFQSDAKKPDQDNKISEPPYHRIFGDVCNQAAALFERTSARSLVIAGANRFAVRGNAKSPCQPRNAAADAAHNDRTMFHTALSALLEAEAASMDNNTTFIQWHGMAANSCNGAFLSAGARGTHPLYANRSATVNRLAAAVNSLAGSGTALTPATDTGCRLVAANNVFGRMVNGVPAAKACDTPASPKNVRGHFLHVEQKMRMVGQWDMWARALKAVFPAASITEEIKQQNDRQYLPIP